MRIERIKSEFIKELLHLEAMLMMDMSLVSELAKIYMKRYPNVTGLYDELMKAAREI